MSVNLDDLSNDEIRVRLLEYGFANLPVTQTTRKVLVKKLKNAMEAQKTKNRRETVAVIKSSDEESIPETKKKEKTQNRRATVAVTEKSKKVPDTTSSTESIPRSQTPNKTNSRRSSRATPAKEQEKPMVTSTKNIINEESDESDVVEIRSYTRRSKTPLSKSETVRTSHKSEANIEPVVEIKRYVEQIAEPVVLKQTVTRRKTTISNDHFEMPARTETPTKFGKTTMTTSYNPTSSYRFDKEEEEDDENYDLDEKDTPYLSNFAKRLSTLKAEPLDAGLPKPKYQEKRSYDDYSAGSSYRYSSQYGSSAYQPAVDQGYVNQMAKDFNKLDRKYSIRKYVYITMLIMVIIAIYVLLFL